MGSWDWLQVNVAGLLNTVGIVGGLLFTAFSFRDARRERELSNLIALTAAHREIWSQLRGELELARVIDDSADLVHAPATKEEEVFITSLILHLYCVYLLRLPRHQAGHVSASGRIAPRRSGILLAPDSESGLGANEVLSGS